MSSTLYFSGEKKRNKPKSRLRYDVEAERVAAALADWPMGFQSLLRDLYETSLSSSVELPRFHQTFSWVFARLIKNDPDDGRAYNFIAEEIFKFGATYWVQSDMSRTAARPMPASLSFKWGTVGEAAEIIGFHMATMKKLIEAGQIPVKRVSPSGFRAFVVDLDWARSQKITKEPSIGMRDAAKVVGVSIETLRAMVDKGTYIAAHRPVFPGSLTREDTRDLAERLNLLLVGKKRYRKADAMTLDRLFFEAAASPDQKADVFSCLLENPALIVGRELGSGMGAAQVRPDNLKGILTQLWDKPALISVFDAGQQLGCSAAVVTALQRAGHLDTMCYAGRERILEASVRRFDNVYEPLASICKRLGLAPIRAYKRINVSRLKHIRVRAQHETIFVHKRDLARAEAMLLKIKD